MTEIFTFQILKNRDFNYFFPTTFFTASSNIFSELFSKCSNKNNTNHFSHSLDRLKTAKQLQNKIPIDRKNFFKKRLEALKQKIETDKEDGCESYKNPNGGALQISDIEDWIVKEEERIDAVFLIGSKLLQDYAVLGHKKLGTIWLVL